MTPYLFDADFGTFMLSAMYLLKGTTCKVLRAVENDRLEKIIDSDRKIVEQERVYGALKKIEHACLYPTPIDLILLGGYAIEVCYRKRKTKSVENQGGK